MENDFTLPKIRDNIVYREFEENSERYILLADVLEYSPQNIILPVSFLSILQLYDGKTKISEIEEQLTQINIPNKDDIIQQILNLYYLLDSNLFLETPLFFSYKQSTDEYIASSIRPSILSGNTYSENKEELNDYITNILNTYKQDLPNKPKGIIVPHIDLRVGKEAEKCYGLAYNAIIQNDANIFIVLGTAHSYHNDYFMLTKKDFQTPLGIAKTDRQIIEILESKLSFKLNINDKLHRYEHSIEIQIPFIQAISKRKDFTILPIIAGSLHDFFNNKDTPKNHDKINEFINTLSEILQKENKKVVFIASADFAHIGRRFEDDFDAETELNKLKVEDLHLIELLEKCDSDAFFKEIASSSNKRKICGLSPIYHLFNLVQPEFCKLYTYEQWNDSPTKSAVSFATLVLY